MPDDDLARQALERARQAAREAGRDPARRDPARRTAGRRGGRSGAAAPAGGPQRFGRGIRDLVADRGWEHTVTIASVMGRWEAFVGPDIAAHCRPERLDEGVLHLVAESSAWATQLRLLAPRIVERLADEVDGAGITVVRVHGPATPDWRHGPRRVAGGRGPRDTYG